MGIFSSLMGGGAQKSASYDPGLGGHILGQYGNTGVLGDARDLYGGGPPVYDPSYRIADFTGAEQAGQRALIQYGSHTLPGMYGSGMNNLTDIMRGPGSDPNYGGASETYANLMGGQGNPMLQMAGSGALSPYYQDVLTGSMNDLYRGYTNTTGDIMDRYHTNMGAADDTALLAGQFGGSRGEVARGIVGKEAVKQTGLANQALSENMGQATSTVLNDQFSGARDAALQAGQSLLNSRLNAAAGAGELYGSGSDARLRALGLLPGMGDFGASGGRLLSEVGGAQRGLTQAQLDEAKNKWDFNQNAPWMNMNNYADLIAQLGPYMSMSGEQPGGSPLGGALGGAVSGYGLTKSPWGAVAGGVAGFLS